GSRRIREWRTREGAAVPVDSPDSINVIGRLVSGAEVSINVAAVPSNPGGNRIDIYGREGTLVLRAEGSFNTGGSELHAGKGKEALAAMPVPAKYKVVPAGTPSGPPYKVPQPSAPAADTLHAGRTSDAAG